MSEPLKFPSLPFAGMQDTIRTTMATIDQYAKGIAIVVDGQHHLLATVTDGDIRRAILAGISLESTIQSLKRAQPQHGETAPVTAPVGTSEPELIALMKFHSIRQVPLLDAEGRVVDLAMLNDLLRESELPLTGVIMAGGLGNRLRPLTNSLPKPMLPVNGRPLLEHMLAKLRRAGIRSVNVTTHYLSESIANHFKDGSEFGVQLNYVEETEPLGTAGALARVATGAEPLLVLNGDILTAVDIRAMLDFHREHGAHLTVGVRQYDIEVPFGVMEVETGGVRVTGITEKPVLRQFINAGIYIVDSALCRLIPPNHRFDMPDLIMAAIQDGKVVISFPVREYWLDIGRIEHYEKAEADVAGGIV